MKTNRIFAFLFLSFFVSAGLFAQSADDVIGDYLKALGGKKNMEKINDDVRVEVTIDTIKISYLDASEEHRVLVKKKFVYEKPDPLSNALAVEIIPKTVAGDVADIDIRSPNYEVINPDPVIGWGLDTLTFDPRTITYVLFADDVSESAKTAKTVILVEPAAFIKSSSGGKRPKHSVVLGRCSPYPIHRRSCST